ncbi:hypothetical protein J27TS8_43610 [Robertmurraya siralis]|uniref:Formate dehydrogenase accessory protein FdhE n=1 Tax=Robertmurraya siralis TaxID=77777 RepID=A0A920BVW7_9BACI|nr:formate dehydrogenase accessory protein FdhE [Robertmurraya siralis]GIN64368.1 hypothetical protein J27TS8_43610 [Robertmurraya siralis]
MTMTKQLTLKEKWLQDRPFLEEIARFHEVIETILDQVPFKVEKMKNLDAAKDEFNRGIPVLKCEHVTVPIFEQACQALKALTSLADYKEVPEPFRASCSSLGKVMEQDEAFIRAVIHSLMNEDYQTLGEIIEKHQLNEGIIWFLGWTALSYVLQPHLSELQQWERQQSWNREYCPTCGALPNMAQLKRSNKGRKRHLICGCCRSQWLYKRMGCPYCKNEDPNLLRIMEINEEEDIRVDVCNSCNSYIKVYTNKGEEEAALLDWMTLHLDLLLKERGYVKMGTHLINI